MASQYKTELKEFKQKMHCLEDRLHDEKDEQRKQLDLLDQEVCLSVPQFASFSVCLSVCSSVCIFLCLSVCLFLSLHLSLSVCTSVCLSVYLCSCPCLAVCLSDSPSVYPCFFYLVFLYRPSLFYCASLSMSKCPLKVEAYPPQEIKDCLPGL